MPFAIYIYMDKPKYILHSGLYRQGCSDKTWVQNYKCFYGLETGESMTFLNKHLWPQLKLYEEKKDIKTDTRCSALIYTLV